MFYYSLKNKFHKVSFKDAVMQGVANDGGLFFPNKINKLERSIITNIDDISNEEIAYQCLRQFVDSEIPNEVLNSIIHEAYKLPISMVDISKNISVLELFNGPTMAFKDFGAIFMARCMEYFISNGYSNEITILVATSGDTGAAVANAFHKIKGINVIILYPSKKVSFIQEQQISTLNDNINAIEYDGTFDDCQSAVKKALLDKDLCKKFNFTTSNSINIGRWLPQIVYYFIGYKLLNKTSNNLAFSVPSGNYGNLFAGMISKRMGLPIGKFISSNNSNNVVDIYMKTQKYMPKASIETISNAMDVGDPSNFIRIQELYKTYSNLKDDMYTCSYSDEDTISAILELYSNYNYLSDPHGAVGYLGAKEFVNSNDDFNCIFLGTAHPSKFVDIVENIISEKIVLPEQIKSCLNKSKKVEFIKSYKQFKSYLLS